MLKRITAFLLILTLVLSCIAVGNAVTYKTLKKGSRGEEVKKMQTALKNKGYYTMKIDGVFGNGTLSAVKAFQKGNGLKVDGIAGPKTLTKLYASGSGSTPKPSSKTI